MTKRKSAALFAAGRNLRSPLCAEATLDANDDAALLTLAGSASPVWDRKDSR